MTEEIKLPEEKPINPLLGLWFRPRRTIHHIVSTYPGQSVILIGAALGAAQAVMNALGRPQPAGFSESAALKIGVVAGLIVGIIMIYVGGWLFRMVGSWFGGEGDSLDLRTALAWGQMPFFVPFFIWLYSFYGGRLTWPSADLFRLAYPFASVIFSVWQTVILSRMFGEVHGFSSWRGFFTLLVGSLLALAVVIVFVFLAFPGVLASLQKSQPAGPQFKPLAPIFSLAHKPKAAARKAEPASKAAVKSRINFTPLIQAGGIHRLKMTDGKVVAARLMEETEYEIYVESEGRILNLQKADVAEVLKEEPAPA